MMRPVVYLALLVAMLSLAACREHLERRDTLVRASGDALGVNVATQMTERWPKAAWTKRSDTDGERSLKAYDAYQAHKTLEGDQAGEQATTSP